MFVFASPTPLLWCMEIQFSNSITVSTANIALLNNKSGVGRGNPEFCHYKSITKVVLDCFKRNSTLDCAKHMAGAVRFACIPLKL